MSDSVKKTVEFQGLQVRIDRPKGFVQKGKDAEGNAWERTYKLDYGFLPKTQGGDGDGLDVFLGPKEKADTAFWVRQKRPDGSFDEFKVFLGFPSQAAAKKAYLDHIPEKFYGGMEEVAMAAMRALLNKEPMVKRAMYAGFIDELGRLSSLR